MTNWQSPKRSTVTPIIMVKDAMKVVEFAKTVFGAEFVGKPLMRSDGSLWNAEVKIGDSNIMFTDAADGHDMPAFIYVHVADADAVYKKAIAAGAQGVMPPTEQFYGEYDGGVQDAQGNMWWVATHRKVLSDEEVEKAAREFEAKSS